MTQTLPDLSDSAPCGPNVEFDADYGELERAAQGKPEQQYGDTIIAAEDPVWKEVAASAAALCQRTYDLRVIVHLAIAQLQLKGLVPFAETIGQIRYLLAERWAYVHPQLDPEDDNDPTLRGNALLPLIHPARVLRLLRDMPLAASRRDGIVTWRTIQIFTGAIEPDQDNPRKSEPEIRGAFTETGREPLLERKALLDECVREIAAIGRAFDENAGYGNAPDLGNLSKLLFDMSRYIGQYLPEEGAAAAPDEPETDMGDAAAGTPAATDAAPRPRSGAVTAAQLTSITTRADAVRLLDLVCRYYESYEPSSPLPLLISRARNLADKGFLDILQDLAPDGLMQAQNIVKSREY
jgi:type VI secretion system protein ImpA